MEILSTGSITLTDAIPWLIALTGVIAALYYYRKNYNIAREKRQEEKRKHEREENERAKEGLQLKTAYDRYKQHIVQQFSAIDFTGLNAYQKKLPLEKVYIRLRTKANYNLEAYRTIRDFEQLKEELQSTSKKGAEEKEAGFNDTFRDLIKTAGAKRQPVKVLILGHPGSGKTTLFKWIALQCLKPGNPETEALFNGFTPFFVSLKDFARNPDWLKGDLEDVVCANISGLNLESSFFKERFERNEAIFLLDGLDEVADEDMRRDVIAWIEKQSIRRNKMLVSSRFSGLNPQKGLLFNADFRAFIIADLNEADIEQFVHKWYEAIETVMENTDENRKEAKRQADELIAVIKSKGYEPLRRIAVNPLLLTIVAIVHRNRAKLPKERHKLYEECLNVMIELWHVSNKRLKVFFPAEVCKNNLSKLANHAMMHNKREVTRQEITQLLPAEIEGKPLDFFLNEMVLKAGLLYESEGKFGFLHLTFQEYLAAWHYAHSSQPLDILQHRSLDYWQETIKLFVNLGNTRQFFEEIIAGLDEKYWQNMNLWEACLQDEMIDEKVQEEIEKQFAAKVCEILLEIPFEESEENKINHLYPHYTLYKHADFIEKQGWQLFSEAKHPFVKTVGASILNRIGGGTQIDLINNLKCKLVNRKRTKPLDFFFENDNSVSIILLQRKKLCDYVYLLDLLKERNNSIVNVLIIRDLMDLSEFIKIWGLNISFDGDILNIASFRKVFDRNELKDWNDIRTLRIFRDFKFSGDFFSGMFVFTDFGDIRSLSILYELKFKSFLAEKEEELYAWADKAMQKLQDLSDEEIFSYFPNSTKEEIAIFRANHPPKIIAALKKGNEVALQNPLLKAATLEECRQLVDNENRTGTFYNLLVKALNQNFEAPAMKEYKRRVIAWLTETGQLQLDEATMHFLLHFDLYADHPERQETEMLAQQYLRKLDYAKWRELLFPVTQMRDGDSTIWVNALYFVKHLN
jgi:energy-coupling factor transporter ATP-binding protein EcfA2